MPLGLQLDAGAEPGDVADDLHRFSLICLQFDSFTDGRPYSQARLLRERYGYRCELRARGNILRDRVNFMRSCGIDALEVTKKRTLVPGKTPSRRSTSIINPPATAGRLSPCTVAVRPRVIRSENPTRSGARWAPLISIPEIRNYTFQVCPWRNNVFKSASADFALAASI